MSAPTPPPTGTHHIHPALEALAATLDPRQFATTLVTGEGRTPYLTVTNRHTQLAEEIHPAGDWYWWSWAQRLAPITDVRQAARTIAYVLGITWRDPSAGAG